MVIEILEGEEKVTEEMFETKMTKELSQINIKCQTTDEGSLENTSRINALKTIPRYITVLHYRKLKIKRNILKEVRGKNILPTEEER